ncbi:TetR/AcrR family transcriptional regulator [Algoriphagus marinus]|uniref:TetR/AcrR family transcriptional regulator n=1 Tax=Algoriphagus marinus TaxID=1925762 RepID=UPI00094BB670|nr:TetR family transcriptional regulator [Algoriphagus marinus]
MLENRAGEIDPNTESKIKNAARRVFHQKGFSATRTRDIAEEAGINLALLNYYFRSKKKLFEIIMFETMFGFMQNMLVVFNDEKTSLLEKTELMAEKYTEMILKEPQVPLFILSELRDNASDFLEKLPMANIIMESVFIKQIKDEIAAGNIKEINPLQFIINLLGLVIFPFVASPLIYKIGSLSTKDFELLMQERKKMIPIWIKSMFYKS